MSNWTASAPSTPAPLPHMTTKRAMSFLFRSLRHAFEKSTLIRWYAGRLCETVRLRGSPVKSEARSGSAMASAREVVLDAEGELGVAICVQMLASGVWCTVTRR